MASTPNIMTGDDLEILAGNKTTDDIPGNLNVAGTLTVAGGVISPAAGPNGAVLWNHNGKTVGDGYMTYDGGGDLVLGNGTNASGSVTIDGSTGSGGYVQINDSAAGQGITMGAGGPSYGGFFNMNSSADGTYGSQLTMAVQGNQRVSLSSGDIVNPTSLQLDDISGNTSVLLVAAGTGGGSGLTMNDKVGGQSVVINTGIPGTVGGGLSINDWSNNLRVDISGGGGGVLNVDPGGNINLYNTGNELTVTLSAGHAGDAGGNVLSMLRSDGLANSGLYMGASNTSGEPSKLAMFQGMGDQTITCEVYGGDGLTWGGEINLYGINNQGGIRIQGNTALTGDGNAQITAQNGNSTVANIGIDYSTIGTGTHNFHAPVVFPSYLTTTLPTAPVGAQIFVSNANSGVGTMAFYNGTNWIDIKTGVTVTA